MYNQVLNILKELNKRHPHFNMGRHLSTALDGYGDIWGLSDKELSYALEKYKTQLEMDVPHAEDVDDIVKEAENLQGMFEEEEEEY